MHTHIDSSSELLCVICAPRGTSICCHETVSGHFFYLNLEPLKKVVQLSDSELEGRVKEYEAYREETLDFLQGLAAVNLLSPTI